MRNISLSEEEINAIKVEENDVDNMADCIVEELGVVGKLLGARKPGMKFLKAALVAAWKPIQDFDVQVLEENFLVFQFIQAEDRTKALYGGPWHFENQLIIIRPVDRGKELKDTDFSCSEMWVRIRKIPAKLRTENMATKIGAMFGTLKVYDNANSGVWSNYMRLRVTFQITKPLRRGVLLEVDNRKQWYVVAYEKLPNFCYNCGMLGHLKKDCQEELVPEEEAQYGSWMRATSPIKKYDKKNRWVAAKAEKIWSAAKLKVSGEESGESKRSGSIEETTHRVLKTAKKKLFDIINEEVINEDSFSQRLEIKDKEAGEQGIRSNLLVLEQIKEKGEEPKEQEKIRESGSNELTNGTLTEPLAQVFVGLELQSSQNAEVEEASGGNGTKGRDKQVTCQITQKRWVRKKDRERKAGESGEIVGVGKKRSNEEDDMEIDGEEEVDYKHEGKRSKEEKERFKQLLPEAVPVKEQGRLQQ
ncbi:unnamed protein product [Linum trigynum]|uniref:CCHC-type domain-containing protein n=1 Tax=Linum trigynum TaxID=586398 RepID=A0AAV2GP45_9ROSI